MEITIWILSIALVVMTVVALRVNARRKTEKHLKEYWLKDYSEVTSLAMKLETELRDQIESLKGLNDAHKRLTDAQREHIKGLESDLKILLLSRKKA